MKKSVEILAPAGSYDSLKAAIAAGADAVYVGGSRFGARAYANNLSEEELLEAIDYVHLHGRSIYLTVNTLLKEKEVQQQLYDYLLPYYRQGIDAVIVQDIGVLQFVKEHFPDLPIHASTQMTITNVEGAKFMESLGVERIVTAREMSLQEIREISEQTHVEIESFVHGALCYCYSGQCLYSSLLGGRSGNRGQCAQPCRLPYQVNGKTSYTMSLKDLCAVDLIPDLIEAGIFSMKIEGRMKKPEYVAAVTSVYRKYVDLYLQAGRKGFRVSQEDRDMLMDIYNRGGFHLGYYQTRNGKEMLALHRPNHAGVKAAEVIRQQGRELQVKSLRPLHKGDVLELPDQENYTLGQDVQKGAVVKLIVKGKQPIRNHTVLSRTRNEQLLEMIRETVIDRKTQEVIQGKVTLSVGECAKLELEAGDVNVTVYGDVVQQAQNQPMAKERIEKQLRKTGNTEFVFDSLVIEMHGQIFVPMQLLNELRRSGMQALEQAILQSYRRTGEIATTSKESFHGLRDARTYTGLYVYMEQLSHWKPVLKHDAVQRIYMDCNLVSHAWDNDMLRTLIEEAHANGKEIYFAMPYIFRSDVKRLFAGFLNRYSFDGVLVRNYESYQFLQEEGVQTNVVLDANLYTFNQEAKQFWKARNVSGMTASLELNYRELNELGCEDEELIVYGYLQMMVSAQCIQKTTSGCTHKQGILQMVDRYHKAFSVRNCCDYCYNVIYNTEALDLSDQVNEIKVLSPRALRLHFTLESAQEVDEVLNHFEDVFLYEKEGQTLNGSFTRGHFKRGIK